MNSYIAIGRLTKDPELKQTPNGLSVCSFTIAVDRDYKEQDGSRKTDFIPCVAWKQRATLVAQYFHKGSRIGIRGSFQSRKYEDEHGKTHYILECIVDGIDFIDSKNDNQNQGAPAQASVPPTPPPAMQVEQAVESYEVDEGAELPFDIGNGF